MAAYTVYDKTVVGENRSPKKFIIILFEFWRGPLGENFSGYGRRSDNADTERRNEYVRAP